jgi:hypothetical protein
MQTHQLIGTVLICAGLLDAATSLWIPNRIPDLRQRMVVRLALLSSGVVVTALGALFLSGLLGTQTAEAP